MRKLYFLIPYLLFHFGAGGCSGTGPEAFDVLVVGGGTGGVAAGIQSARLGASTLVAEPTGWLGGMLTSAGVSAVDGNYRLPAGIWGEFKKKLEQHYGGPDSLRTGWVSGVLFEPSVGNRIFHGMAAAEKNLDIRLNTEFVDASREGGGWIVRLRGVPDGTLRSVRARILIDATELGDVARACGAGYDAGMESRAQTGEDIAPWEANGIIQDFTYAAILKDYGRDATIPRPEGYDPSEFACCCVNPLCSDPREPNRMWPPEMMITYGRLPGGKYMINWPIEGNDHYANLIDMTPGERAEAVAEAKLHTLRFVYFIQNELGYNTLGLADDEFPTEDLLPLIPYHRESRRIHGLVRFRLGHITDPYGQPDKLYRTCIAVGDYPVDHHHARYRGTEQLPDLHFHPIPSYGLPLGTLIPRDVDGLIVAEKSISVSNIVNGTTRLQPVVLQAGQAAGALAALAVGRNEKVCEVPVREVQNAILAAGGYLLPYLDAEAGSPLFGALQRVGSTGIMKGVGRSVDWSNQTWFRAGDPVLASELAGLCDLYPSAGPVIEERGDSAMTVGEGIALIARIMEAEGMTKESARAAAGAEKAWREAGLGEMDRGRSILRGEMALLIDCLLDPFNGAPVDINGQFIR